VSLALVNALVLAALKTLSALLLLGKIKDFCRLRIEDARTQKQMGFANKQTKPLMVV